ncbi:MAG TPA: PQQ-dependent sugar dehydrogenase [Actinomycetota bacterium]
MFADDLAFPTNLAFAPDDRLFFTERDTGNVRIIRDGKLLARPFVTVPSTPGGETGLLGIALHPEFDAQPWVYLSYSSAETGTNVLARVRAEGSIGGRTETILEGLPVSTYHNGGDLAFGPDGMLYATVGESHDPSLAQDPASPGGKVLRLTPEGDPAPGNPFGPGNPAWSMGHRNSFGICFDPLTGFLWETENGPSGHDEVNLIRPGGNYGWPEVSGPGGAPEFIDPTLDFPETIVPTGCAVYPFRWLGARSTGALFFGDFTGTLHRAELSLHGAVVERETSYLTGLPGITDVVVGPDERLYVATERSILRLPAELVAPSPKPMPTAGPTSPAPPNPLPTVPSGEAGGTANWIPWALAAAILVGGALLLRRRA